MEHVKINYNVSFTNMYAISNNMLSIIYKKKTSKIRWCEVKYEKIKNLIYTIREKQTQKIYVLLIQINGIKPNTNKKPRKF